MHAFDILGDPVRRRILELLAGGERASGEVVQVIGEEFGITQSGVSQHLKVLRDHGFATVRAEGTRRIYAVAAGPLAEVDTWLDQFRRFWDPALDALATEIARGKRARAASSERRPAQEAEPGPGNPPASPATELDERPSKKRRTARRTPGR